MAGEIVVEVPDIGDFTDVPIIEVHVAVGSEVALDEPLLTLESDKATMDVPGRDRRARSPRSASRSATRSRGARRSLVVTPSEGGAAATAVDRRRPRPRRAPPSGCRRGTSRPGGRGRRRGR